MAENENTAEIANKIANDIFKVFHWEVYAQKNSNFECVTDDHLTPGGDKKSTHPGDVVFYYQDPYLKKLVCLHTDLKSYKKTTINQKKIREALNSLAMTIECASLSSSWVKKFLKDDKQAHEIRGLLFVANHDNKATEKFTTLLNGISKTALPIAKGQTLHVLGPLEISALYSVATDIKLGVADKWIDSAYRFHYPDLTLWKRQVVDDSRTGATIEMLLAPYFILRHAGCKHESGEVLSPPGSVVYYSRDCETTDEFVYLLDCLSRFQLINSKEQIKIRAFSRSRSSDMKNNFDKAKFQYCKMWGFEGDREAEIQAISIDAIQSNLPNYVPDEIGWKA